MAPILIGIVPFGLIYGVTAVDAGLSSIQAAAMSSVVFAGSAQLAAVDLMSRDAAIAVIVATALVINARHLMYSASIAPRLAELRIWHRSAIGYLLTDQAYAVAIVRWADDPGTPRDRGAFIGGAALALWATWQTSSALGVVLGTGIPADWSLDFAVPLVFLALVVPTIKDRGTGAAALVSGIVAVLAVDMPLHSGLLTAAAAGILGGLLVGRKAPS
jgi:4-azaleucine resistance transporter AzlC